MTPIDLWRLLTETSGESSQTRGWRNVAQLGQLSTTQVALTDILILVHEPIPVLVDVLQSFLGSKRETECKEALRSH